MWDVHPNANALKGMLTSPSRIACIAPYMLMRGYRLSCAQNAPESLVGRSDEVIVNHSISSTEIILFDGFRFPKSITAASFVARLRCGKRA